MYTIFSTIYYFSSLIFSYIILAVSLTLHVSLRHPSLPVRRNCCPFSNVFHSFADHIQPKSDTLFEDYISFKIHQQILI